MGCHTLYVCAQACPLHPHVASLSITVPGCSRGWESRKRHSSFPPVGAGKGAGVLGRCRSEGCCLPAPTLQPWHLGQYWAPRVRGISWMAWQGPGQIVGQHREGTQGAHLPGLPSRNLWGQRWCHQPRPQHTSAPAAPATHTHHSPRAATASFRTSLFLSSKGLASARITRALYGSSCRTERALSERAGCWLPPGGGLGPSLPLYMQEQGSRPLQEHLPLL